MQTPIFFMNAAYDSWQISGQSLQSLFVETLAKGKIPYDEDILGQYMPCLVI
ncbi:Golgi to ER traffic-like protein [Corchorus olitorius]|uniref:Golgi to ER traffic-like protein n=1 Tax=Corchorus olitorius TaxID=93759 RepID=A0A1R3I7M3_9ROSI|nr:Golgi to ER traffic-like protein [Corchorus olitorius]